jgi:hypothetical protein
VGRQLNSPGQLKAPENHGWKWGDLRWISIFVLETVTTPGRDFASASGSVTTFLIYRNRYRGTGQARFEIRDGLIDGATIERCLTRREAESVAHALNTKPRKQTMEDVLERLGRLDFSSGGPRRVED